MGAEDLIPKNFWVNLTVVLPGMVTYGTWRIVIFLIKYTAIDFKVIDDSLVLSLSVLFAVAFLQQVFGIGIEAVLTGIAHVMKEVWPSMYLLFVGRFSALAKGQLKEGTLRTIGQFFLSLNLAAGQCFVLLFAYVVRNDCERHPQPLLFYTLAVLTVVSAFVAWFRCRNAIAAIRAVLPLKEHLELNL